MDFNAKAKGKLMIIGHRFVRRLISVPGMLSATISVPTFSCLVCLTRLSFKEGDGLTVDGLFQSPVAVMLFQMILTKPCTLLVHEQPS